MPQRKQPTKPSRRRRPATAGQKALSQLKTLKKALDVETHYKTTSAVGAGVDDNGLVQNLNVISQGDTDNNRFGDRILMKWVEVQGYWERDATDAKCKCFLVLDRTNDLSTGADYLVNAGAANAPNGPFVHDNRKRFILLKEFDQTVDTYNPIKSFRFRRKVPYHTQFEGGTTTILKNVLRIVFVSSDGGATPPEVTYTARLHFAP